MSFSNKSTSVENGEGIQKYLKPDKNYKQVRLKGKYTNSIKYLIIIDDDEEGSRIQIEEKKKKKKVEDERVIEEQVEKRMRIVHREGEAKESLKKPAIKIELSSARVQTRSSKTKSSLYYDPKNYASIPPLMDHTQAKFKQMIIKKCMSLRIREYVVLDDQSPSK